MADPEGQMVGECIELVLMGLCNMSEQWEAV